MKHLLLLGALLSYPALGAPGDQRLDELAAFFKAHLIGHRLYAEPTSGSMDSGRLQYDFSTNRAYSGLMRTDHGLKYTVTWSVIQTNFKIQGGQRILPGENKDRIGTGECEIKQSLSVPGKLIGYCRTTSNTFTDPTGNASSIDVSLVGDRLTIADKTIGFSDYFANNERGFKPGISSGIEVIDVVDGKTRSTATSNSFDLDPATLVPILSTKLVQSAVLLEK